MEQTPILIKAAILIKNDEGLLSARGARFILDAHPDIPAIFCRSCCQEGRQFREEDQASFYEEDERY
jgi:hypothetical protein